MSQSPEINEELLSRPGGVEELVKQGRIPAFMPAETGGHTVDRRDLRGFFLSPSFEGAIPQMVIFVPPEGVEKGDHISGEAAYGFEFFSSNGESKGMATMIVVDRELGESLRARSQTVLHELEQSNQSS